MRRTVIHTMLCAGMLAFLSGAHAGEAGVARVVFAQGDVSASGTDGTARLLAEQSRVMPGDTITTGNNGRARLRFSDASELRLNAQTQLQLKEYRTQQANAVGRYILLSGSLRFVADNPAGGVQPDYQLETPGGAIKGGAVNFDVQNCLAGCKARGSDRRFPNGVYVRVHAGDTVLGNTAGQLTAKPGQIAYMARKDKAPQVVTRFPDAEFAP